MKSKASRVGLTISKIAKKRRNEKALIERCHSCRDVDLELEKVKVVKEEEKKIVEIKYD